MASPRNISQRTVLTPHKESSCPNYQRPTAAQKNRATPQKKDVGQGFIPSPSPTNKSPRHRHVNAQALNSPNIHDISKSRVNKTLPTRKRAPCEISKPSAHSLHANRSIAYPALSPRKAAADFSTEETPLKRLNEGQSKDFVLPPANSDFDTSKVVSDLQTQGHTHHRHMMDTLIASPKSRLGNKTSTLKSSEECFSECIHSSPARLTQREYYFVHTGLDELAKLERCLNRLQNDPSLSESAQTCVAEASQLFECLVRKYNELTRIAPLHSLDSWDVDSKLETLAAERLSKMQESIVQGLQQFFTGETFMRAHVNAVQHADTQCLRAHIHHQALAAERTMRNFRADAYDREQAIRDAQVAESDALCREREAKAQHDGEIRAKDAKIESIFRQNKQFVCLQRVLQEQNNDLQRKLREAETAKAEVIKKLEQLEQAINSLVENEDTTKNCAIAVRSQARSYTNNSCMSTTETLASDEDSVVRVTGVDPLAAAYQLMQKKQTAFGLESHLTASGYILDGSTQAESSSDAKRRSQTTTDDSEISKSTATEVDDGNEADDESLSP
ncbi:MAG: hypothetical protein Q9159_001446 [Coniocarpon cinnabarinum]